MLKTPWPGDLLVPILRDARDMLMLTWAGVRAPSGAALHTAAALGSGIHKTERELTERLEADSDDGDAPLRLVTWHVERIADAIDGLVHDCQQMEAEGTIFAAHAMREVNALFERAVGLLECTGDLTLTGSRVLARHVEAESARFEELVAEYFQAHEERIEEGVSRPASSTAYLGIIDYLCEISRQARLVALRIGPRPPSGGGPLFSG
jgi:hypothetical protein